MVREEARVLSEAPRLLREVLDPVDPAAFLEDLAERSEEVFAHAAASLESQTLEGPEDARGLVQGWRAWAKEHGIKARDLLHPLRLALTGKNRGPALALVLALLGPEEARERIERTREARLRA